MTGKTRRASLMLTDMHRSMLAALAGSRTAPVREAERAKVLLKYAERASITDIQRAVGVSRPTIYQCIDKAVAAGVRVGLKDRFHRPKDPEITPAAKAWVVSLACTKPKDHGLAADCGVCSREFIALLKRLAVHYPEPATIRIVLDNHSAHISKETMAYLATRPGRFEYVHTPKHGSWLNLVECAFSKMARSFLRHIRVSSKDELKQRLLKGIAEMNEQPFAFRWQRFDLELA